MPRKRKTPRNVSSFVDRHGKERWRYRKAGEPSYCFKSLYGTAEFDAELAVCRASVARAIGADRAIPGSIGDLIPRWYRSVDFSRAADETKHKARLIIERFRNEFSDEQVGDFTFEHIEALLIRASVKRVETTVVDGRERKRNVGGPEAAIRLRKLLRRLFAHGVKLAFTKANPVELAGPLAKSKSKGFHTWTEAEIAQYEKRHPIRSKARLALEILIWTAQRGGDARLFGPQHISGGKVRFTAEKTGTALSLTAAPQLLAAIRATPTVGVSTYLVTDFGLPFSRKGFGQKMRHWCDEAGLPHCTAHGLRKAAARRAAERGATNQQLKALGGWRNDKEVGIYTAAADQARLADETIGKVIAWDLANRDIPVSQ